MNKEFEEIHKLLNEAKAKIAEIPAGRAGSLVLTKIDEAKLWLLAHEKVIDL